jgi:ribosomal protein S18 acetylase RimI-like enzyme
MAVQQAAYRVEADLIGYEEIPGLREGPADITALDLTVLAVVDGDGDGDGAGNDGATGGRLLGLVGYSRRDGVVDIDRLAVAPQAFRRGVGRALVEAVHEREADARRFVVQTGTANAPAVALYTSLGYRPAGRVTLDGCAITRFARPVPD